MFKTDRAEEKEKDLQSAETFRTIDGRPIRVYVFLRLISGNIVRDRTHCISWPPEDYDDIMSRYNLRLHNSRPPS